MKNQDRERAERLSIEALERIVSGATDKERGEPTREHPLAGYVHVSGIGRIRFSAIERELESRTATSA